MDKCNFVDSFAFAPYNLDIDFTVHIFSTQLTHFGHSPTRRHDHSDLFSVRPLRLHFASRCIDRVLHCPAQRTSRDYFVRSSATAPG